MLPKGTLAALLVSGIVWGAPAVGAAVCGDANSNGIVDAGDAAQLLQYVAGLVPAGGLCGGSGVAACLDLNQDGTVDIADLVLLLNVVAGNPVLFRCASRGPTVPCGTSLRSTCPDGDPLCRVVSTNLTLPGGCGTFIDGMVLVPAGVVLTIEPGAMVKGRRYSTDGSPTALVLLQDAKLNAAGTAAAPIVFTSDQPEGSRGVGDWGGVVFNGRAPTNCPGGSCLAEGLVGVFFGGTSMNDSSGVLSYARIEYAGVEVAPDNELDAVAFNAVGRGTIVNHVQANVAFDDCFAWFGGTVNAKHLVASGCGDDMFDWQYGYSGSVQYALGMQDVTGIGFSGASNGLEGDNNENGFDLLPRSDPRFCNVSVVGTKAQGGVPGQSGRRGIHVRRGTAGTISNVIVTDFTETGVRFDDNATATRACADHLTLQTMAPVLSLRNTILFDNGNTLEMSGTATSPCTPVEWLALLAATNHVQPGGVADRGPDPGIGRAPYPYTSPRTTQYVPAPGGPAQGSASTRCGSLDVAWMDDVQYLGAFEPGATVPGDAGNWLDTPGDWISFAAH